MFTDSRKDVLHPQVGFATIVHCPRIGEALFGSISVPICISVESTPHVYSDNSQICAECRNRNACKAQAGRAKKRPAPEEVACPQSGDATISMAEAQGMRM